MRAALLAALFAVAATSALADTLFDTPAAPPASANPSTHLSITELVLGQTRSALVLPADEAERVPFKRREAVLADMDNRRMFVKNADGVVRQYRVGIGRPHAHIPLGRTRITSKRVDPSWWPTPRARRRDPTLPAMVKASSDNPLGTRAMNFSWKYYLIHGTNDARKIGRGATWGCISLYETEVGAVFDTLTIGTRTRVEPTLLVRIGDDGGLDPVLIARLLVKKGTTAAPTAGTRLTKGCTLALTCRGPVEVASLAPYPPIPTPACRARACAVAEGSRPLPAIDVAKGIADNRAAVAALRKGPHTYERLTKARRGFADAVRAGHLPALANLALVEARLGNLTLARRVADAAVEAGILEAHPLAAYFAIEGIGGPRDLPAALALVRSADAAGAAGTGAVYDLDLAYLFSPKHWGMLQQALTAAGFDAGPANKLFKDQSWAALTAFANRHGVAKTVSLRTLSRLDLVDAVSNTLQTQRYIRRY
ncbi:MAG: L,D-transpeptidase [Pseudomonadota bacterium]